MQAAGASNDRNNDRSRTDRPRFRQDLFAEVVEDHGTKFIDVMDPDSGSLFRFYEVEYSLACGMDGERDVPGIVKWAQDELGLSPSANEVRAVIATLGDLGFIASSEAAPEAASEDLATGVVTSKPAAFPTTEVALGAPGASPLVPPPAPLAPPPPVALGASGPSTGTARKPAEPVEDFALGAPGARVARPTPAPQVSEVSIDLADHIDVGRADVAEAVRQSKIMTAVELPPDLEETFKPARPEPTVPRPEPMSAREPIKAPEPVRPPEPMRLPEQLKAPEPAIAREPSRAPEAAKPAQAAEPARPITRPEPVAKPPVELPRPPVVADKTAVAPPAPASRVSPVLVVLLILIVFGAAGFAVWKFVLQKDGELKGSSESSSANTPPPVKPTPPPPPAPPPPPTAKIALVAPDAEDIKAAHAGTIETILAEKPVKAEEVVVRITGDRPIEALISSMTRDETKLSAQVDAATKANAADLDTKKKALDDKRDQIAAKKKELTGFALQAPHDGKFTPAVKNGVKISEDDVLGKLERDPQPTATFQLDTTPFAALTSASVTTAAGAAPISCTIEDRKPASMKVTCPADAGLTDGASVTLQLPGAAPAAGSAAGSAAPAAAGSAAANDGAATPAAAGSAEVPAGSAK